MSNYVSPRSWWSTSPTPTSTPCTTSPPAGATDHRGKWFTAAKLSGFCLLIKRAVLEAVGGLDERFGLGLFDDDDLAERARRAGFSLAVAQDLFVHHFGSRTFAGAGVDAGALLEENQAKFQAKWGLGPAAAGRRVALTPWAAAPRTRRRPRRRPTVSLTMIVRNEEANLPACLASADGLFDEVVVVDTGSTDRTAEIARAVRRAGLRLRLGRRLRRRPQRRPGPRHRRLRLLARRRRRPRARPAGAAPGAARRRSAAAARPPTSSAAPATPTAEGGGGETVVDHVRLFPLREDVRWTYRVHEQILPALRRAGVPVRWTDVDVRHTGYTDPRPAAPQARARRGDPPRGAGRPARRPVRPLQPRLGRHRAAGLARGPGPPHREPRRLGARPTRSPASSTP